MVRRGQDSSPFTLFSFQDIITCVSGIIILITLMLAVELTQRVRGSPQAQTEAAVSELRKTVAAGRTELAKLKKLLEQQTGHAEEQAGQSVDLVRRDLLDAQSESQLLKTDIANLGTQEQKLIRADEKLRAELFDHSNDDEKRQTLTGQLNDLEQQLQHIKSNGQVFYNSTTPDGKQVWLVQLDGDNDLIAASGRKAPPTQLDGSWFHSAASDFSSWLSQRSPSQDFIFLLVRPDGSSQFNDFHTAIEKAGFSVGFDLLGPDQTAVDPIKGATIQ